MGDSFTHPHPYERDSHSGAGNCHCGWPEHSRLHPHAFRQRATAEMCVCSANASHPIHTDAATAVASPMHPSGLDAVQAAVRAARGADAPAQVRGYA